MSATSQVSTLDSAAPGGIKKPAQPAAVAKPKSTGHDVALSGRKATITIHPSEGIGGDEAVPIGLNGFMYQVPRGTPQEVPVELLEILEHAVTVHLSTGKDMQVNERAVPRFAFTVHSTDKAPAVVA